MATTNYSGSLLNRVPDTGGSVRVTIANNVGRGNGGTSLPCKQCWIVADAAGCRVRIGTAVTDTATGEPIPTFGTNHYRLWIPIDDISKLYFYGSGTQNIDITYTC